MTDSESHDFSVYAEFERKEMLRFIPDNVKTVLDVGCGVGNFGALLKAQRNAEVWGIEVNPDAAAVATGRLDAVLCSPFNQTTELPKGKFDCIVFNDVLEHMVDPYQAIDYAKSLLSAGGKLVASIPNVRYFGNVWSMLIGKSWEYVDLGILDRTHLRFFTKSSIASMFERHGYSVQLLEGINALDFCDPWLIRRFHVMRLLTLNHIEDMRWLQFAVVAEPIPKADTNNERR